MPTSMGSSTRWWVAPSGLPSTDLHPNMKQYQNDWKEAHVPSNRSSEQFWNISESEGNSQLQLAAHLHHFNIYATELDFNSVSLALFLDFGWFMGFEFTRSTLLCVKPNQTLFLYDFTNKNIQKHALSLLNFVYIFFYHITTTVHSCWRWLLPCFLLILWIGYLIVINWNIDRRAFILNGMHYSDHMKSILWRVRHIHIVYDIPLAC